MKSFIEINAQLGEKTRRFFAEGPRGSIANAVLIGRAQEFMRELRGADALRDWSEPAMLLGEQLVETVVNTLSGTPAAESAGVGELRAEENVTLIQSLAEVAHKEETELKRVMGRHPIGECSNGESECPQCDATMARWQDVAREEKQLRLATTAKILKELATMGLLP